MEISKNYLIDELDIRIILELYKDGRAPATAIAASTGAEVRTVRNRIARLVKLGAIRIGAIMDPAFFGYNIAADVFISVEPASEEALTRLFQEMPEVSYIAYGEGSGEISLEVRFKNNAELRAFLVHRLPAIPGVINSRYTLVPQIIKNINEWLPLEICIQAEQPF